MTITAARQMAEIDAWLRQDGRTGDPNLLTWEEYLELMNRLWARFDTQYAARHFEYWHPVRLQRRSSRRFQKEYPVKVAYTDWGDPAAPTLVCLGGVASAAKRFNFFAEALSKQYRIVCMDWVGRGLSGWLAAESDYTSQTLVEQLRQLIQHLGVDSVAVIGSSLGGNVAIELCARAPRLIRQLVLNDVGPYIPAKRRRRRAEAISRHYVFRTPAEIFRRSGAAQKNDGPVGDHVLLHNSFHQTRWSVEDGGRVYRHDMRAMQAYRHDAQHSVSQWDLWAKVRCPVLVLHGMLSDALLPQTLNRMRLKPKVQIVHIPDTGHTPALSDPNQIELVGQWLQNADVLAGEASCPYAELPDRRLFV